MSDEGPLYMPRGTDNVFNRPAWLDIPLPGAPDREEARRLWHTLEAEMARAPEQVKKLRETVLNLGRALNEQLELIIELQDKLDARSGISGEPPE
jgi:hypothetical protein